jgi:excisionase family DNA binding protein
MRIEEPPTAAAALDAREALRLLTSARPEQSPVLRLDDATIHLPQAAFDLLLEALSQMANGNAVTLVPLNAELTSHQAADLLNVSRPTLIRLLDAGEIPFRLVGTHRRIRSADLLAYQRRTDPERDAALAELTRQAQDLGLGY